MPETAIIIRTFNEQKHLGHLFDAIDGQTYRDFETIVVDSGSLDDTRAIAEARADLVIRISSHDFTFGYSLNVGVEATAARFVVIVSAHTRPCGPDWLGNLIAPLREDGVAMTYGRQCGVAASKYGEAEDMERLFGPTGRDETRKPVAVNNANSAIRRDLWTQYPFNDSLTGLEDMDWAHHWMAQSYSVRYVPEAAILHIHEETWRQIRNRFYREAVAWRRMGLMGRRHVPREVLREVRRGLADYGRVLAGADSPVNERLTWGQRLREIAYYRAHKTAGLLRGLIESHPLETRAAQEEVFFDRPFEAVVIHGPGKASLEKRPTPTPNPGDVLIRVAHTAVCATDLEILNGTLGYYQNGQAAYPITPGHEFSGRVAAVGQNVNDLAEGDPVVAECIQSCGVCGECRSGNFIGCPERAELGVMGRDGAYAEYVVVPARFAHKLPADMDLRRAALAEPTAVVLKALRRLEPALRTNGSDTPANALRCAVLGAGPLGHLCARVLDHNGFQVTAYDRNDKRRALFDGTGIGAADDLEQVCASSPIIVEVTGDPDVLNTALHASPANASLLLLGLPYGHKPFSFEAIAAYDKTVIGSVGSTAEDFADAIRLLPRLDLDAYFQCPMPLASFADAWNASRNGDVLKVMLEPGDKADP